MEPELTTADILKKVDELSQNHLAHREDLELIIDTAIKQNKISLLKELSFHAKFSAGLLRVVQKRESTVDEEYFLKAVDEYRAGIEKVRRNLEELLSSSSDFIKSVLTDKYLLLTQTNLTNLNTLCADLSYLKLFFNDLKNIKS
jgi:hypothetical protein